MLLFIGVFVISVWAFMTLVELNPIKELRNIKLSRNDYPNYVNYLLKSEFNQDIPCYKFYSDITFTLVKLRKEHGVNVRPACMELRKAAQRDFKEDKRIKEEFMGLVFQYVLIAIFTWFFLWQVQLTLSTSFATSTLWAIGLWQILGLAIGAIAFIGLRLYLFNDLSRFFYSAYVFRSLILASRPLSEVITHSRINELKPKKQLSYIYKRFFTLVKQLKIKGILPTEEFSNMVQELWDFYDDQLLLLKKYTIGLKLFLMLFFVFPSFLFAIYLSMQSMSVLN